MTLRDPYLRVVTGSLIPFKAKKTNRLHYKTFIGLGCVALPAYREKPQGAVIRPKTQKRNGAEPLRRNKQSRQKTYGISRVKSRQQLRNPGRQVRDPQPDALEFRCRPSHVPLC
jgi:hypothetical protein